MISRVGGIDNAVYRKGNEVHSHPYWKIVPDNSEVHKWACLNVFIVVEHRIIFGFKTKIKGDERTIFAVFIAQVLVGPSKQLKQIILIEHNRRSTKEKRILYIWYHKEYKFKRKVKEDDNTVRKYQSWRGFRFVSAFRNSTSFLFLKMYFRGTIWRGKKAKRKRKGQGSVCVEEKEKLVNNTLQILARKTCSLTHYSQPGFDEIVLQIYCAFIIIIITE